MMDIVEYHSVAGRNKHTLLLFLISFLIFQRYSPFPYFFIRNTKDCHSSRRCKIFSVQSLNLFYVNCVLGHVFKNLSLYLKL